MTFNAAATTSSAATTASTAAAVATAGPGRFDCTGHPPTSSAEAAASTEPAVTGTTIEPLVPMLAKSSGRDA